MTTIYNPNLVSRDRDDWGSGAFAASRGGRFHHGRDFEAAEGQEVESPVSGRVLRIGWPYANEHYRLIEILETSSLWRFFYVLPCVVVGDVVTKGQLIGHCQNISARYQDPDREPMTNHVHIECLVDPALLFARETI